MTDNFKIDVGSQTDDQTLILDKEERLLELIEELGTNQILILVGSGLSKAHDLPDWKEFLKKINPDNSQKLPKEDDIDRSTLSNTLHEILVKKGFKPGPTHKLLIMSGVRGILTTNYDRLIEASFNSSLCDSQQLYLKRPWDLNWYSLCTAQRPFFIKLHGDMDDSEELIISKENYDSIERYAEGERQPSRKKKLWERNVPRYVDCLSTLIRTNLVVSIGFSWDDPAFEKLFKILYDIYGDNSMPHYNIKLGSSFENKKESMPFLKGDAISHICYPTEDTLTSLGYAKEHKGIWGILRKVAGLSRPNFPSFTVQGRFELLEKEREGEPETDLETDLAIPFWLYTAIPRQGIITKEEDSIPGQKTLYVLHPIYNADRVVTSWLKHHAEFRSNYWHPSYRHKSSLHFSTKVF